MKRSPSGKGAVDRYIKFQVATVTRDERNQEVRTWTAMNVDGVNPADGGCFAKATSVAPSLLRDERFEAAAQQWVAKTWTGFVVAYSSALFTALSSRETCRLIDDAGSVFDILYVSEINEDGRRRRWIEILGFTRSDEGAMTQ